MIHYKEKRMPLFAICAAKRIEKQRIWGHEGKLFKQKELYKSDFIILEMGIEEMTRRESIC